MTRKMIKTIIVVFIWLCIWQLISYLTGLELIIASPVKVLLSFFLLLKTQLFYICMMNSFIKIILGFMIAFVTGIIFATLANQFQLLKEFLSPLIYLMKALPVASFIILLLIWAGSKNLSVIISFIVVFPMIYIGTLEGFNNLDIKLLEMSKVFRMSWIKKARYIYAPEIFPYIISNCKIALGMCWKAGISAEVIGLPSKSIGEQMYLSKLYLVTDELLAWSVAIIIVSVIFEKLFLIILNGIRKGLEN